PHNVVSFQTLSNFNRQALTRENVDHCQGSEPAPGAVLIGNKIQAPYVVGTLRPRPLPALRGHAPLLRPRPQRQPFLPVEPVYQLLSYVPALADQKNADLAVSVPDAGSCQLPDPQPQFCPWSLTALVSVRPDRHCHHSAGSPFADPVPAAQVAHHRAALRGLYQFFRSTPCSLARSSVSSATTFFSRPFSSWSCRSCRTWSTSRPAYSFFQR